MKLRAVGGTAVAFFYVLSGFILTYVYSGRLTRQGIWKFYYTRWARIWPLHIVCLLLFFLLISRNPLSGSWEQQLKLVSHVLLLQSWIPNTSWVLDFNGVAWSISTEMAFYSAFPLLLLAGRRRFGILYALIGLSTAVGAFIANGFYRADPTQMEAVHALMHFNPLFRIFEFATGMLVCHLFLGGLHIRWNVRSVGLQTLLEVLALSGIVLLNLFFQGSGLIHKWINVDDYRPLVYWLAKGTGSVVGFAFVVWVFSWSRGLVSKLLARRWFVYLGEISFAFYLVHQLIQVKIKSLAQGLPLTPLIAISISLVLTLAVSALLYAVVEVPCKESLLSLSDRKWSKAFRTIGRIPANVWRSGVLPVSIAIGVCCAFVLTWEIQSSFESCVDPAAVRKIIARSRPEFRGVVFEDEALLHGLSYEQVENGTRIYMVWQVFPSCARSRFIHICDQNGQVLRQCNSKGDQFIRAVPDQLWVDEVFVEQSKLNDATFIGLGFYSPELKAARVKKGPRSMSNHRLDIVQLRDARAPGTSKALR